MKRTGKFYYKNEKEVMKMLGLKPVPGSGSGWVLKEDGESETIMAQLKSTDASSYRINMLDLKKLEYHAEVSHKTPVFVIQFLKHNKIYLLVDFENIGELLNNKQTHLNEPIFHISDYDAPDKIGAPPIIKSTKQSRENFYNGKEEKWKKKKSLK